MTKVVQGEDGDEKKMSLCTGACKFIQIQRRTPNGSGIMRRWSPRKLAEQTIFCRRTVDVRKF